MRIIVKTKGEVLVDVDAMQMLFYFQFTGWKAQGFILAPGTELEFIAEVKGNSVSDKQIVPPKDY